MGECVFGYGPSPLVTVSLAIDVEVIRSQFLAIGISMR